MNGNGVDTENIRQNKNRQNVDKNAFRRREVPKADFVTTEISSSVANSRQAPYTQVTKMRGQLPLPYITKQMQNQPDDQKTELNFKITPGTLIVRVCWREVAMTKARQLRASETVRAI